MTQGYMHETPGTGDDDIRNSIRVIQRERNTKLVIVIFATIIGICVLLATAYLGFTPR